MGPMEVNGRSLLDGAIRRPKISRHRKFIGGGWSLFQQLKIAASLGDIATDLLAESIDRREFDLVAQAIQKMYVNFRLRGECDGVKVQQVSFDGE